MVLLNLCARLRLARGEGLGPISIKHGPLTILIYDTPTVIFYYFFLIRRIHVKLDGDYPANYFEIQDETLSLHQ